MFCRHFPSSSFSVSLAWPRAACRRACSLFSSRRTMTGWGATSSPGAPIPAHSRETLGSAMTLLPPLVDCYSRQSPSPVDSSLPLCWFSVVLPSSRLLRSLSANKLSLNAPFPVTRDFDVVPRPVQIVRDVGRTLIF